MKKLVVGIVAVICVHIGFALMVSTEPAAERASAAVPKLPQSDYVRIAPIPEISEDMDVSGPDTDASSQRPVRSVPIAAEHAIAIPMRPTARGLDRVASRTTTRPQNRIVPLFAPVIITTRSIPLSADIGERKTIRTDLSVAGTRPRKRSLIAKALPIIKKPWDWLKFVGSRLK
jgi:hypothetical protein